MIATSTNLSAVSPGTLTPDKDRKVFVKSAPIKGIELIISSDSNNILCSSKVEKNPSLLLFKSLPF